MPYKVCVYKGCENYTRDNIPCGNKQFTLFRFPKDVVRSQQWIQNGQVPDVIPENRLLMCSEHFEQKYINKNHRRTLLTSTAVPIPYTEKRIALEETDKNSIAKDAEIADTLKIAETLDGEMIFSIEGDLNDVSPLFRLKECISNANGDGDEINGDAVGILDYQKEYNDSDAEYCVESTTMTKDTAMEMADIEGTYAEVPYEEEHLADVVTQSLEKDDKKKLYAPKKRKMESNNDEMPSSSKTILSKSLLLNEGKSYGNSSVPAKRERQESVENDIQRELYSKERHSVSEEIDSEALIDKKSVTCFIFKGEEYVQMPKEYYVQEKMELMKKLRKYENLLQAFKRDLLDLDLS